MDASPPPGADASCPNGALSYSGSGGYVSIPSNASLDPAGSFTLEAWIKPKSSIGGDEVHIISHHDHETSDGYVLMLFDGLALRVYSGSGYGDMSELKAAPGAVSFDVWHHVAGTFEASSRQMRLFVDGTQVKTGTASSAKADRYNGPLNIGAAAYDDAFFFDGLIDEARVSNTARYDGAFQPVFPLADDADTIGTWHFSEGSGTAVNEARSRHNGSLISASSAPAWVAVPECPLTAP